VLNTTVSVSIRRSLVLNISSLMLLLGGSIFVVMFYGTQRQVSTLSTQHVQRTLMQTHSELERYIRPVTRSLGVAHYWSGNGVFDLADVNRMRHLLQPVLTEFPQMSALLVANSRGEEYMLLRNSGQWFERETRVTDWLDRSRVSRWESEQSVQTGWETLHYDPRKRPWYTGAIERLQQSTPDTDLYERVHWTAPYQFFTTKEPGITASLAHEDKDGQIHVVGIDILLTEISRFTTGLKVSDHGFVFVMTDDGRILGLPNVDSLRDETSWQLWLLKTPDKLGVAVIDAGIKAYQRTADKTRPFTFENSGELWWGGAVEYALSSYRKLLIAVVVPETDVLGDIQYLRYGILLVLLSLVGLTLIRILGIAKRYSRPLEALVEDSYRISHGDLGEPNRIATRVSEVQQLARAHDVMREGLRNLLKLERDMQLAKQIQQKTLPAELPYIPHFKIAVWNFPADETGGDSYDVLAVEKNADGSFRLAENESEYALCLLADAAGHGIGPALSVTQVRSMLRMAVRQGLFLPESLEMVNRQILEDLSGGRFITLWLAILDAPNKQIHSYSAGQAPLLHFHAQSGTVSQLDADSPPLGIVDDLQVSAPQIINMAPGDFFVVFSDGIFEATNAKGEAYGVERVKRLITLNADQTVQQILEHLQHGLGVFTESAKPKDDRTALIIKLV